MKAPRGVKVIPVEGKPFTYRIKLSFWYRLKLVWKIAREKIDFKWYQYPLVMFLVFKIALANGGAKDGT
ncbi:hypothetical protein [Aeribacillus pallidus]|uniref:hypothetical protein n=1 Tax=Aeribacillus pallidus TaxID=33936 RepID=UPI003D21C109